MFHVPANEADRVADLVNYGILDSAYEESFDRITRLTAFIFGTPISAISLIDSNRQWFKSMVGLKVRETSRDVSFCNHVVCDSRTMVVPDALEDDRFRANPLVTGEPKIRFYAGAPLVNDKGFALGAVCIIDSKPRPGLSSAELQALDDFAGLVIDLLEARKAGRLGRRPAGAN